MFSSVSAKPRSTDDFVLQVRVGSNGLFGVFANADLILEHPTRAEAEAHCQRLRRQQAKDAESRV